jgi:hypothetical protein
MCCKLPNYRAINFIFWFGDQYAAPFPIEIIRIKSDWALYDFCGYNQTIA